MSIREKKNELELIFEAQTITFPKSQSLSNMDNISDYIRTELPGIVHVSGTYNKQFLDPEHKDQDYLGTSEYTIQITSSVSQVYDNAEGIPDAEHTHLLSGIKFSSVPGGDLSDYDRKPELWDQVRHVIEQYFKK